MPMQGLNGPVRTALLVIWGPILVLTVSAHGQDKPPAKAARAPAPAPLYKDPTYHGSCDPQIVWNTHEQAWWIFYTGRRATRKQGTYVATPIGVAASDNWHQWRFTGYCDMDPYKGQPDMPVTFWAPGIVRDGDTYHMFVTYKGEKSPTRLPWGGEGRILHYQAPASDLLNGWQRVGELELSARNPIDAGLVRLSDDRWLMVYRAKGDPAGVCWATSENLTDWRDRGLVNLDNGKKLSTDFIGYQEAPYPFRWRGQYWLLTDPHKGLAVYRSDDAETWTYEGRILQEGGDRARDDTIARHPSVAVVDDRAFIFYHVEPWRTYKKPAPKRTPREKRSFLQVAELTMRDGKVAGKRNYPLMLPAEPRPNRTGQAHKDR